MLLCSFAHASETAPVHVSKSTRTADHLLEQQPVYDRVHPGFEVPGMRLGDLLLHPSAKITEIFDTNVYATKRNRQSDLITVVHPSVSVSTSNPNHGLSFTASSSHGRYLDNNSENYNDYALDMTPFSRISRASNLKARLLWERGHELRTAEAANVNFGAEEPVRYTQSLGRLWWQYQPGRLNFTPYVEHRELRFTNVSRRGGGPTFVNNDRNRNEDEIGTELSYEFFGKNKAYLCLHGFARDYRRGDYNAATFAYSGPERDSKGTEARIGTRYFLSRLTDLDVNAGYYHQDFDANILKNVDTAVAKAVLTWQVSPLTTVNFDAERRVWETVQDNASAFVQNRAGMRMTHELRRYILLGINGDFGSNAYVGDNRQDDYWQAGLSATYKMSRYLGWKTDYLYEERDSSFANADYAKHQVFVSLQVQF